MSHSKTALTFTLSLTVAAPAAAQSFNIDVGDPALGQPSSSYVGAAGQAGPWTAVDGDLGSSALIDVNGTVTSVSCSIVAGAGSTGNSSADNPLTSGDDELLMDDLHDVGPFALGAVGFYSFDGLENGTYDVYTYSWAPGSPVHETQIEVIGSLDPLPIVGGSDWTGGHVLGETYAVHRVAVTGSVLDVAATAWGSGSNGSINGFQLLKVETGTAYCLATVNSTGAASRISATGSTSLSANDLVLSANQHPAQPGIFIASPSPTQIQIFNGFLCVSPQGLQRFANVSPPTGGVITEAVDYATSAFGGLNVVAGSSYFYQRWFRDPAAGGAAANFSDGLEVAHTP